MAKADQVLTHTAGKPRLVTIASGDNPNLLISATTYPQTAGSPITLDLKRTDGAHQPFSWWILNPVSVKRDVYQILFHAHDGHLCLTASAAAANSPLNLASVSAANMLQLWLVSPHASGGFYISSYHYKTDIGFPDIPLKGTALQLMGDPAFHDSSDPFLINNVKT